MALFIKNSLFQPFETHQRFPLTTTLWKSFTQSYSKLSKSKIHIRQIGFRGQLQQIITF